MCKALALRLEGKFALWLLQPLLSHPASLVALWGFWVDQLPTSVAWKVLINLGSGAGTLMGYPLSS